MAARELLTRDHQFHPSAGGGPAASAASHAARPSKRQIMSINLKIPDIRELKPRITVFGVGGAGGNAVNNMITAGLAGRRLRRRQHRRPGADHVEGRAHHPDGRAGDRRSRRRLAARGRPRRRRGGDRRDPRSSDRRAHGVRHRRHGRRHRHRRRAGHRPGRARARHPHRRRGDQAVPLRGRSAACASPKPASSNCRRWSTR